MINKSQNVERKTGVFILVFVLLLLIGPLITVMLSYPASRSSLIFVPAILMLGLWTVVVIWVYVDAEKMAMSGLLWGILVMFGSIIGLVIYLMVRSGTFARITGAVQQPCAKCGKLVNDDFKACPYCGTALKDICPSCKKPVAADWKVCPYCQAQLTK